MVGNRSFGEKAKHFNPLENLTLVSTGEVGGGQKQNTKRVPRPDISEYVNCTTALKGDRSTQTHQ